jgi:Flp pilus assembly protein TadG
MASIIRQLRARASDERGAELIELAIVFPILLLLVAGMVDFGFLFQRFEVVTNAAREGARIATLPGYGAPDARDRVRSYLSASGLTEPLADAAIPVNFGTETLPTSGKTVNTVSVAVSYPSRFSFIGPIAAMVGGSGWGTITLTAASVMRVEGAS